MSPRIPRPSEFPSTFQVRIAPPPTKAPKIANAVLLFHGLGDRVEPFEKFATQMALPETVCICLQGPNPMPLGLGGFHWADDFLLDQQTGHANADSGFANVTPLIRQKVIQDVLIDKCGFVPREILLLGNGQGGMVALSVAATMDLELGGVISFGGPLPDGIIGTAHQTPVQILGGGSASSINSSNIKRIRATFTHAEYHIWDRRGDGMPQSRAEILPVMQFLSRRLRSLHGLPSGCIRIS